ncbi:YqiA/YcfP family alpha/beta fold hydrolase [Chromobacterium sp. IIBBL 290-4]|uniref:YqiA/YcfP family alpha/beta fold hydrolase n=1 Tax=Chromobacterium sp. IIBBL 290-4 TaxID=2953890 RepID=UPI0020B65C9B|nr:YqiA/YcfP family alpha/beta fold hydrolase [Chromobacterium sp. IIBBL 290-4]UTH75885.1 alpha/beta fold hydrolase [Chromobacterium sp. IIBBL 290-4]
MHIVYLHGFNSSPQSLKAGETAAWLAAHSPDIALHCPRLSPHPAEAIRQASALLDTLPPDTALIGSSLGGFYATDLAEARGLRAALINPAIRPDRDLHRFLGEQTNPYTGEVYTLDERDMAALQAQCVATPALDRYWLLLGTCDEVLDWREAARHYRQNRQTIFNGDDHRLNNWPKVLPDVIAWARAALSNSR